MQNAHLEVGTVEPKTGALGDRQIEGAGSADRLIGGRLPNLTPAQVAKRLGIGRSQLYEVVLPDLPHVLIGAVKRYRPADVDAWEEANMGYGPRFLARQRGIEPRRPRKFAAIK